MLAVRGDFRYLIDHENDTAYCARETRAARPMRRDQQADELLRLDFLCWDDHAPPRLASDGL
jgi:hypothetical protein